MLLTINSPFVLKKTSRHVFVCFVVVGCLFVVVVVFWVVVLLLLFTDVSDNSLRLMSGWYHTQ